MQDIVIVGCDEFAHTSVLKLTFQHKKWRQNTSSHAHFFSVLSVSRTCNPSHAHACGSRFVRSCVVPLRTSKKSSTHSMFHRPLIPRRAWPISIILFPRPSPSTSTALPMTGSRRTLPVILRQKDCGLAIWLNQLLSHFLSPRPASTSAVSTSRSSAPRGETASTLRTTTLPPQPQPPEKLAMVFHQQAAASGSPAASII